MSAIPASGAIRAADEDVAEELHLDLLEASAAAALALALGGIEAEGAGVEAALAGRLGLREHFADVIERADIHRRIRARRLAERSLVHHQHAAEMLDASEPSGSPRRSVRQLGVVALASIEGGGGRSGGRSSEMLIQRRHQDIAHQRGLARAADSGEADKAVERNADR